MNELGFPFIGLSIVSVMAMGVYLMRAPDSTVARRVAMIVAASCVLVGLVGAIGVYGPGDQERWADPIRFAWWGEPRPLFALDALNAALLPFSAVVVLSVILGSSRLLATPTYVGRALIQLAATWMLFTTLDLGLLVVAWILGFMPAMPSRQHCSRAGRGRVVSVYLLGSSVLLIASLGLVAAACWESGVSSPLSLIDLEAAQVERLRVWGAMPLMLGAIVMRKGVFPFHSWIPALAERQGPLVLALLTAPQAGAFVLVRVAIPLFPGALGEALPVVARVALMAALYGAIVALAARNLRRAFGWLVVSQSALILVGLESSHPDAIAGALTLWISVGLALTGLAVAIGAVESRIGKVNLTGFTGLDAHAPWLGGTFLLLGMASVGLPGSLGFVAEDLLVHGVLESYPGIGVAIVVATACNGFTVVRCFVHTFYGPARVKTSVGDLLRGERFALVGLSIVLIVMGLFPRPLVGTRADVAMALATELSASKTRATD